MTPDHLHATISIAAMKKGKHVLMHKPIANRLYEGRQVIETARKAKVATHLMAYGAGVGNGLIAERIKAGVIGPLREVHSWSNRPVWPQYAEIPADKPAVPAGFDWDLWLGPALDRPYHPHYTHTVFRGWYDFGGGSMADMGIYALWPVFTGLDLGVPLSAEARATHTCSIVDNVSRVIKNDFSYPTACTLRFRFAARGDMPALDLFWYDGGMKPRLPAEIEAHEHRDVGRGHPLRRRPGNDHGRLPRPEAAAVRPGQDRGSVAGAALPPGGKRESGPHGERLKPWVRAVQGGEPSPGSFLNAGPITDAVNLGTVALRAGRKVLFDSANMKITNLAAANKYLYREYRPGWEL